MIVLSGLSGSPSLTLDAPELTHRQQEYVMAIWVLKSEQEPVTFRKLAGIFKCNINAVAGHLRALTKKGYVVREQSSHSEGWSTNFGCGSGTIRLAKPLVWREIT